MTGAVDSGPALWKARSQDAALEGAGVDLAAGSDFGELVSDFASDFVSDFGLDSAAVEDVDAARLSVR